MDGFWCDDFENTSAGGSYNGGFSDWNEVFRLDSIWLKMAAGIEKTFKAIRSILKASNFSY